VLDISFKNKISPKKGKVLLSDPFMVDDYFQRSVVYLCEHTKEGSFGFVLNNFMDINLNELNPNFPSMEIKMSLGGPVETDNMYFIHSLGKELNDSLILSGDIYIGGDFEQLYSTLTEEHIKENKIRFFLGYSGWAAGQLDQEIQENAWVVANVEDTNDVMDINKNEIWKYFMTKLGDKYKLISKFPINPNEN
jgi:putative transcriptional regulator